MPQYKLQSFKVIVRKVTSTVRPSGAVDIMYVVARTKRSAMFQAKRMNGYSLFDSETEADIISAEHISWLEE